MAGLLDFLQSASNSVASNVTAPVDGIAWLLRKAGIPVPDAPLGGSDWAQNAGLTRPVQQSGASLAGESLGMIAPMLIAAKAPQVARGLLQAGENLAVPQTLSKQAGVFMGPQSRTWDKAAAENAQKMADAGIDARQIWSDTGTWKGPDGKWRQEIPDNTMSLHEPSYRTLQLMQDANPLKVNRVSDVVSHRKLFNGYPDTQDIGLDLTTLKNGGGAYAPATKWGDPESIAIGSPSASTSAHELQHAIQQREGFARGGSPTEFDQQAIAEKARDMLSWQREVSAQLKKNPALDWNSAEAAAAKEYQSIGWPEAIPSAEVRTMAKNPLAYFESQPEEFVKLYGLDKRVTPYTSKELYKRLAGEAEARATQSRIPLDAAQRRALFPADSYDVPIDQLIIRKDGTGSAASMPFIYPQDKALATAQRNAALPIEQGGLGLGAENTAMERARALGFTDEAFHGTNADIKAFDLSKAGTSGGEQYGTGIYTATNPQTASGYASPLKDGANVMPLKVSMKSPLTPETEKQLTKSQIKSLVQKSPELDDVLWNYGDVGYEGKAKVLSGAVDSLHNFQSDKLLNTLHPISSDFFPNSPTEFTGALSKILKNDGVNVGFDSGDKFLIPWAPNQLRSRFAAFDPMRRNEADLLGRADPELLGLLSAGLLGYGGYNAMSKQ